MSALAMVTVAQMRCWWHAVAELHQRAPRIEAQHGDAAPLRLGDDGAGRGAVGEPLREADDLLFQLAHEVEVRLGQPWIEVVEEAHAPACRRRGRRLPGRRRRRRCRRRARRAARLAAGHLGAGQVLQLERDVLERRAHPVPSRSRCRKPPGRPSEQLVVVEGRDAARSSRS